MNIFALIALFVLAAIVLQALILRTAVRVNDLPLPRWRTVFGIVLIRCALGFVAGVAWLDAIDSAMRWVVLALWFVLDLILVFALIRKRIGGTSIQITRAWITQELVVIVLAYLSPFALRPFFESYYWPNSSMSPNIRGYHVVVILPDGNHFINAANDPRDQHGIPPGAPSGGIVAETYEYRPSARPATFTHTADRFLCNKTKFPERWDAVVLSFPEHPGWMNVKRLVGLPGERVRIKEGAVWINDVRLRPPDRLCEIWFEEFGIGFVRNGEFEPHRSLVGSDEYFVLGDNTHKSGDSRHWGTVKKDQIVGVVDLIYWPPERWKLRP